MLYKLEKTDGVYTSVVPVAFQNLGLEKHLEDLLANNLLEVFFENDLMPIFQERSWKAEADIYALNKAGDLVIFELKRGGADAGAVHQAFRYCEAAAHWGYERLQSMLATYTKTPDCNMQKEHQENFNLERPLDQSSFNGRQQLIIVGSAGDDDLVNNVDYWKSKGIWLDFIPYRLYQIGSDHYFEFFSIPYDRHVNPADHKGVLFDTNRTYDEESIWYMCDNDRVAAFGGIKGIVHYLGKGDIVFLYHKGEGIVAAGEVKSEVKEDAEWDALYRDLKWLTPKPTRNASYKTMPAWRIKQVLDRDFWWAKTLKVPYLSREDSKTLLDSLKTTLT